MSETLWEVYHLFRLIGRSLCSKKVVEHFWDIYISCVTVDSRVVDSDIKDISSFSGKSLAVLIYYLHMGDAGLGGGCLIHFQGKLH